MLESTSIRVMAGAATRLDGTGGIDVVVGQVVVGIVAVVVVGSTDGAESDDVELHALASKSATTRAPTIDESLRITALIVPQSRPTGRSTQSRLLFALVRTAGNAGWAPWCTDSLQLHGMKLGIAVVVINLASALMLPTVAWPGGPVRTADQADALGGNISGLTFAGPSSLWAVRDGPSTLSKLDRTATGWAPTVESGGSRSLRYVDGDGSPDAEAVTTAAGDDTGVYVAAERDSDEPSTSRNSILRFDTSSTGRLRATQQWELNSVLPATGANAGIEGLTWIPDDVLVSTGFRDATGKPYAPTDYPSHGKGLFVAGLESNGTLYVVALRDDGGVALIASMPSGLDAVMEVVWSATRQELWTLCDNTCGGMAAVLRPSGGSFAPAVIVEPPPEMASLNNEGFALGSSCADGTMAAIWADDGASAGHVIREATLDCAAIATTGTVPVTQPPIANRPAQDSQSGDSQAFRDSGRHQGSLSRLPPRSPSRSCAAGRSVVDGQLTAAPALRARANRYPHRQWEALGCTRDPRRRHSERESSTARPLHRPTRQRHRRNGDRGVRSPRRCSRAGSSCCGSSAVWHRSRARRWPLRVPPQNQSTTQLFVPRTAACPDRESCELRRCALVWSSRDARRRPHWRRVPASSDRARRAGWRRGDGDGLGRPIRRCRHRLEIGTHLRERLRIIEFAHTRDHRCVTDPEAEHESVACLFGEGVCGLLHRTRVTLKDARDTRREDERRRLVGQMREVCEGISSDRIRYPQRRVSERLHPSGELRRLGDRHGVGERPHTRRAETIAQRQFHDQDSRRSACCS